MLGIWDKQVEDISNVLPHPQTTYILVEPVVEDSLVDKSTKTPTDKQKKVEVEKTPSATIGKVMSL